MDGLVAFGFIVWIIYSVFKKMREGMSGDSPDGKPTLTFEQRIEQALERAKQAQERSQGASRPVPQGAKPAPPPIVRPAGKPARVVTPPMPSERSRKRSPSPPVRSKPPIARPTVQARERPVARKDHVERIPAPHSHAPHEHKPPLTTKPERDIRSPRVVRALEENRRQTAKYQKAAKSTGISIVDPFAGAIGNETSKKRARKRRLGAGNLRDLVIFSEIMNRPRGRAGRAPGGNRYPAR